jgi:hypothetical protein
MYLLLRILFFSLTFWLLTTSALSQNYAPAVNYSTGSAPAGLATGDFNRDGNIDIVVVNDGGSSLSLFLGNGDGTFQPAVTIPVGSVPISVTAADFNEDGSLDLAVSLENSTAFQVLFGNGDGTFQSPVTVPVPSPTTTLLSQITAVDLNGDGRKDLLVASISGVHVFLNDGHGGFTPTAAADTVGLGFNIGGFTVADFNHDGHPDLAWIGISPSGCGVGQAFLSLGNGDGTFQPARLLPTGNFMPGGITAADFNHDGRMDIVVSESASLCTGLGAGTNAVQVLLQQPDGSFRTSSNITSIVNPGAVIEGDFDSDGNLDIAVLQSSIGVALPPPSDAVMIYRGDGSGGFSAPSQFALPTGPNALAAASFTNTVALDLAVTDGNANLLSLLVNQGANTLTLSSSSNPANMAAPVTLTATVEPKFPGSGALSGSVIFADGKTTLGEASVDSSGLSKLSTLFNIPGNHPLLAVFGGNSSFAGGSSATLTQVVNKASPPVTLASSKNPSSFGEPVQLAVTVSAVGSGLTPTGTVNVTNDGNSIASGTLDNTGKVVLTVASLPVGSNSLVAQYAGDANYAGANSSPLIQTVNKSSTATVLALNPNPSVFGQQVALAATVSAAGGGAGIPTGNVTFSDGGTVLATAPVDSTGKATATASSLAVGSHSITASYAGDGNFLVSASPVATQVVNKSPTTTTVTASPGSSVFGQTVTVTANVIASGGGAGTPSGPVTFSDGATTLGSSTLDNNGKASLSISSLSVGTHSIVAKYGADNNFLESASVAASATVNKSPTVTTLAATPNPSVFGQTVTLTASVAASGGGSGAPSGTITFNDAGTALGTSALDNNGRATFTVSTLAVGTHTLTASYGGDNNFLSSTASGSGAVTQVVNQSATVTTLSSSANPSVFGQSITLTAGVTASAGGAGIPSGTVTFTDGAVSLGSVALDSTGRAALTLSSLAVGSHSITASYSGSTSFVASSSSPLSQAVNKNSIVINLTSAPNPSTYGQTIVFSVQVAPAPPGGSPGTSPPTGTITFTDGNTVLGTATLDSTGKASLTVGLLAAGSHSIVASYGGDANFSKGSSSPYLHQVNQAKTQASLTTSMNPTTNASTITLNVNVVSSAGIPSGVVNFLDGTTRLASAPLDGDGSTSLPLSNLAIGNHQFTASYDADRNFASSQSTPLSETVVDSHSGVTLTSSANPQTVTEGVTLVAAVTPALGGKASGGVVIFADGPATVGNVPLLNSGASLTTTAMAVGDHKITASYQVGPTPGPFDGVSPVLVETIKSASPILIIGSNKQDFTISIQQTSSEISAGQTFTTQVTITPVNGLTGALVTLCGGTPQGATCTVTPGMTTLDGKTPIVATLTLTTTGPAVTATASLSGIQRPGSLAGLLALGLAPLGLCLCSFSVRRKRRHRLFALALLAGLLAGCGGSTSVRKPLPANTPPGTYIITVQSQSGSMAHSGQITLAVK